MPVTVNNLSFYYARKTPLETKALEHISFTVKDGEFVGIMGHTGCGKSTLLQLLAGLLTPSEGQILLDGADINSPSYDRKILRQNVGIVFQYPEYQLFETTVEKDVAFSLKQNGVRKSEITDRVRWALTELGFSYDEIRKKSPLSLSGGEKRRVAIAGVLASDPKILIFDEPIAGLDPYSRQEFMELISRLNRQGRTIFMVSHNTDFLCEYAGRLLVFHQGNLKKDGTPDEVFKHSDELQTLQLEMGNVRKIAQGLYEKGVLSSPVVTKYETLLQEIKNAGKAGKV